MNECDHLIAFIGETGYDGWFEFYRVSDLYPHSLESYRSYDYVDFFAFCPKCGAANDKALFDEAIKEKTIPPPMTAEQLRLDRERDAAIEADKDSLARRELAAMRARFAQKRNEGVFDD